MERIIRITAGINKVNSANPYDCFLEIKELLENTNYKDSDILVLPRLALCPPSSGNLLETSFLSDQCSDSLKELMEYTKNYSGYLIVGTVIRDILGSVSAIAVIAGGDIVSLIPTKGNPSPFINHGFSDEFSSPDEIFSVGELRFKIHSHSLDCLLEKASEAANNLCDLYIVPVYEPMTTGKIGRMRSIAAAISEALGMGIVLVNGGISDSSHPYIYNGFYAIFESGAETAFASSFSASIAGGFDFDLDILRATRPKKDSYSVPNPMFKLPVSEKQGELLRSIIKNPFLPKESWAKSEYLSELFSYQVQSLVSRMSNTGIDKLVVGVSGGIDSTAALLVAVSACDSLGLPRANVHGITLPGLGTSEMTYFNALALLERLETTRRDISIRPSVLQHFADIGHSGNPDTAYENAQARERTQLLLDIANMVGGLVVGSSDLSEEALGFCTFGGDHLANYNVNICITKTMLRELLAYFIDCNQFADINDILADILETPVSPELLPVDEKGDISQKTEDILGPYELHEFFLYYFVGYKMKPSKIFRYAYHLFGEDFGGKFIKEKLALFIRKFCANQFKRSCAPDASSITEVNLLGVNYFIPSDVDPTALLSELNDNVSLT